MKALTLVNTALYLVEKGVFCETILLFVGMKQDENGSIPNNYLFVIYK